VYRLIGVRKRHVENVIDVNLQTEEIYCNYSVLIGSPE